VIALVRYNAGNTRSVLNALHRLGVDPVVTDDPDTMRDADKVIFPGVGEAASAMAYLREHELDSVITSLRQPFLGICLGLQLLCTHSEERDTDCLGIFPARVKRFPDTGIVPHMGWNDFTSVEGPLFNGVHTTDDVYFVHSYYAEVIPDTIAVTEYLTPFSAALARDNFYAVQFHTEKSADVGLRILQNFLSL
jgi:glutamine amidotransferase